MSQSLALGVDVGGTKIAFVLVNQQGDIVAEYRLPTRPEEGADAVIGRITEGIKHLRSQMDGVLAGVGIGCPGPVDNGGVARAAVNLYWKDVPLVAEVKRYLADSAIPVWAQNDVNAVALGEMYYGTARGCDNFVYLAVGTGLGAGAIVRGQIVEGAHFLGMEVGHMPIIPNGRLCKCGQRGCVEMYVSGVGLLAGIVAHRAAYPHSVLTAEPAPSTEAILAAADVGDALALHVLDEAAEVLTSASAVCLAILDPELFVIGGGLGHAASPYLFDGLMARVRERAPLIVGAGLRIEKSQVMSSAVGAAALVWHYA